MKSEQLKIATDLKKFQRTRTIRSFLAKQKTNNVVLGGMTIFTALVVIFYLVSVSNWFEVFGQEGSGSSLLLAEALVSSFITAFAFFLSLVSFLSYRREKTVTLMFVFVAAFLFAIKGVLFTMHTTFEYLSYTTITFEPTAILFDFGILFLLFIALLKK